LCSEWPVKVNSNDINEKDNHVTYFEFIYLIINYILIYNRFPPCNLKGRCLYRVISIEVMEVFLAVCCNLFNFLRFSFLALSIGLLLKDILPHTKVYVFQYDVQMLMKVDSGTLQRTCPHVSIYCLSIYLRKLIKITKSASRDCQCLPDLVCHEYKHYFFDNLGGNLPQIQTLLFVWVGSIFLRLNI